MSRTLSLASAVVLVAAGSSTAQTTLKDTYLLPQLPAQGPFLFAHALDVADVDSDGDFDIAVGHPAYNNGQGAVWVCLGPDFETRLLATIPALPQGGGVGLGAYRVSLADFNLDGYCELVAESVTQTVGGVQYAGRAFLFWGPDYQTKRELPRPYPPEWQEAFGLHHAIGDLTGDGRIDLAVSAPNGSTSHGWIAIYDGASDFTTVHSASKCPAYVSGPNWGNGMAIVDIDGDGLNDLVTPKNNWVPFGKTCWAKSGDITQLFYFPWNAVSVPTSDHFKDFRWIDVDGDGFRDLVCAGTKSNPSGNGVFIQYGPTFLVFKALLPIVSFYGDKAWYFDLGDIDRDGDLDVALGGPGFPNGRVTIFWGPEFTQKQEYVGGNSNAGLGWNVRVRDLDSDGFCEVIASAPGEGYGIVHIYRHDTLRVLPPHTGSVSLSAGGSVPLSIEVGKLAAGGDYLLLMSLSGSSPGLDWNAAGTKHHLPMNFDAFTTLGMGVANSPVCPGFVGRLDASGNASASLVVPPVPELALWAPQTITVAGVVSHNGAVADYATHAATITLTP